MNTAGLTEQEFASCASVNLPEAAKPFLDLSPAEVVSLVRAGDLDKLAGSKTVWLSGWETHLALSRVLAAVRAALNARPDPPEQGGVYRAAMEQLRKSGRISHGRLLSSCPPHFDGGAVSLSQGLALRLRGKLKTSVGSVSEMEKLRAQLTGDSHGS